MTIEQYIEEFEKIDKSSDSELVKFGVKLQNDFIAKKFNNSQLDKILSKTINTLSMEKRDYLADAILNEEY
jgi:hypothetical protein